MVTDEQVRLFRDKMKQGETQQAAAAAAGMKTRTAREWQDGPLPSQTKQTRTYRTRGDPFAEHWEQVVEPLLRADVRGKLEARTVIEQLIALDPDKYSKAQTRTMQRRIRDWRALRGPEKEVYFQQDHHPGHAAGVDFTNCNELGITIAGEPFEHLLFELTLLFSKWTWAIVAFSETFEALVDGIQQSLWKLGGVPKQLVIDNLSAATHELRQGGGRALNTRFSDVCVHLGVEKVRRINVRKSNENGSVESRHNRTKNLLEQALLVRGSRDFGSREEYEQFAQRELDARHNGRCEERLAIEREHLQPLPPKQVPTYTESESKVRRWSTIRVRGRSYSVPARLIGHTVTVRVHPNTVEIRYRDESVDIFPRLRGMRTHRIDYRHVISSLARKPGAFANYRYREELFPSVVFRRAYDALCGQYGDRADVEYVRILKLAANTSESAVGEALARMMDGRVSFDFATVEAIIIPRETSVPDVQIGEPELESYDALIGGPS